MADKESAEKLIDEKLDRLVAVAWDSLENTGTEDLPSTRSQEDLVAFLAGKRIRDDIVNSAIDIASDDAAKIIIALGRMDCEPALDLVRRMSDTACTISPTMVCQAAVAEMLLYKIYGTRMDNYDY